MPLTAKNATKNLFDAMNQPDLLAGMGSIAPGQRVKVPFGKNNKLVAAIQPSKSHIINSSADASITP
jgi:hypothetical protein